VVAFPDYVKPRIATTTNTDGASTKGAVRRPVQVAGSADSQVDAPRADQAFRGGLPAVA
jgi:hypothetical protein